MKWGFSMDSHLYQVVTPENIAIDYEIAGIGSRSLALAIDLLLQSLFIAGLFLLLNFLKIDLSSLQNGPEDFDRSVVGAIAITVLFLITVGYFIIMETVTNGQTLGKMALRIRVRKELGYPPNFWDILLRNIIRPIDFLPFFYTIGFITMFLNPKCKRLGDYAAGTIVVKEMPLKHYKRFLESPSPNETPATPAESSEELAWLAPVTAILTQENYLLIRNLTERSAELRNFPELAYRMLKPLIEEAVPEPPPYDVRRIAKQLIREYERIHFIHSGLN
jgi:uncharacterized RDD family membrane protein YckC